MSKFHLADQHNLDAEINAASTRQSRRVRMVDAEGRATASSRLVRATLDRDVAALTRRAGSLEEVSSLLLETDAEVDLEVIGKALRDAARVFVDEDGEVVHHVVQEEVILNPDGTERERRPRKKSASNVALDDDPVKLSGRKMKKSDVYNRFVFTGKRQLTHSNGLTYKFLFEMAQELEASDSLMIIGSGPRGLNPLIFTNGGTPYRGFLEGRTNGTQYQLILHLSNQELKAPPKEPVVEPAGASA